MTQRIRADRVHRALRNIEAWCSRVPAQAATHLFPLLALLERGAGRLEGEPVQLKETPHEFEFWDRYCRIEDTNTAMPYFNPITLRRAEAGFPHSNSATIRKNTFRNRWKAARSPEGEDDLWILDDGYADIVRKKVLTKAGSTTRVPVVDVAAIMFREQPFEDGADARTLEAKFREMFPQGDADYQAIFQFIPENPVSLFSDSAVPQDYDEAIKSALVEDVKAATDLPAAATPSPTMDLDDPVLVRVQQLLKLGTSGIIFTGVPGSGKSYYAKRIANHLAVTPETDVFRVQLHPSYGYEDFVEGYRPDEDATSGYRIVDKTFVLACRRALEVQGSNGLVIVIVDEINRGDPARVFGELLTYIERGHRNNDFILPFSGQPLRVPDNLVLLGTMNPFDRSVAQIDAAFVRRFDQIEVAPSRDVVEKFLSDGGGFPAEQVAVIGDWFDDIQGLVPFGLGHAFFVDIRNLDDLRLIWTHRMLPSAAHVLDMSGGTIEGALSSLKASFDALLTRLESPAPNA